MGNFSWDIFNQIPIIGIMRNLPEKHAEKVVSLYTNAGLSTVEITMNSDNASETISLLSQNFGSKLNVGAGTVCTLKELNQALGAGAQFIVTPVLDKKIIKACNEKNIPVFPGAYTPTEIYKAWKWGASMVKVFPATKLGPEFIKDVLAPLHQIKLVPTGGVGLDNFTLFLKAGAKGLGIGSDLFPRNLIEREEWDDLNLLFSKFVEKYQQYQLQPKE